MNDVYSFPLEIRAEHVDFRRRMRLTSLMELFQQCCIAHTEQLGMGRDKTLDKGFLWVVNSGRFLITRLPEYGETVLVECYPGKTLHYFFPRQLTLKDAKGNVLVQGVSVWSLIDAKSRSFIDPAKNGIEIQGKDTPEDLAPKVSLPTPAVASVDTLLALPSDIDINGHLHNAAYCAYCLNHIDPEDLMEGEYEEFCIQFKKELPMFGETQVHYGKVDGTYYFHSPHFALTLALKGAR